MINRRVVSFFGKKFIDFNYPTVQSLFMTKYHDLKSMSIYWLLMLLLLLSYSLSTNNFFRFRNSPNNTLIKSSIRRPHETFL